MKKGLVVIVWILVLLASGIFGSAQSDQYADNGWMQIEEVIAIGGRAFDPAEWRIEGSTSPVRVRATWYGNQWGALGNLDILRFSEAVDPLDLESIFDDAWIAREIASYAPYQETARCEADGTLLIEFDGTLHAQTYRLRYWFGVVRTKQVLFTAFAFPETFGGQMQMDIHAERLYPALPSCAVSGDSYPTAAIDEVDTPSPALDVLDIGRGILDSPLWQVFITEAPNKNPDKIYIAWHAYDLHSVFTTTELLIDPLERPNNVRQIRQSLDADWFNDLWVNYESADLAPECAFEADGEIWIQRDTDLVFDSDDYASRTWAWFSADGLYRYTASLIVPVDAEAPHDLETYARRFAEARGIEGECQ